MFDNLFKKKAKLENNIPSLSDYWCSYNLRQPNKIIGKIVSLEQEIKRIKVEINKLEETKRSEDERVFKPIAKQISYHLAILTNTQLRIVYNPLRGLGISLEQDGLQKYRVYLSSIVGIGLHTWRYTHPDDGFTPEYSRVEPIFITFDGAITHDFSNYNTPELIRSHLDTYCIA